MQRNCSLVGFTFCRGTAGDHKGPPSHTSPHSPLREEIFPIRMESSLVLKLSVFGASLLCMLTACGATPDQVAPQQAVTVSSGFQSKASPIPTIPTYLCGAWSSNNAPGPNSTIFIYARITKDHTGVSSAATTTIVPYEGSDQEHDKPPASDNWGNVSSTPVLAGR